MDAKTTRRVRRMALSMQRELEKLLMGGDASQIASRLVDKADALAETVWCAE